ncbi:MAG: deiodinase-like protein [Thermoanaerobaculia bacterium]
MYALSCFPHQAGPRLAHFADSSPTPGSEVPDVVVYDADGGEARLADVIGRRPVVLQLGSRSCPVFRYRRFGMQKLQREFAGRVDFLVLYTQEAHPVGSPSPYSKAEWDLWINRLTGVRLGATKTLEERRERAADTVQRLELDAAVLVDGMDDAAWSAFGAAPSPAFVLDADGRVVLRQVWVDPSELRPVLRRLLTNSR